MCVLCWELSPPGCFCYPSHCLLFVVPAPLQHQQLHSQQAAMTPCDISAKWNPSVLRLRDITILHLTWKLSSLPLLYLPPTVKLDSQNALFPAIWCNGWRSAAIFRYYNIIFSSSPDSSSSFSLNSKRLKEQNSVSVISKSIHPPAYCSHTDRLT